MLSRPRSRPVKWDLAGHPRSQPLTGGAHPAPGQGTKRGPQAPRRDAGGGPGMNGRGSGEGPRSRRYSLKKTRYSGVKGAARSSLLKPLIMPETSRCCHRASSPHAAPTDKETSAPAHCWDRTGERRRELPLTQLALPSLRLPRSAHLLRRRTPPASASLGASLAPSGPPPLTRPSLPGWATWMAARFSSIIWPADFRALTKESKSSNSQLQTARNLTPTSPQLLKRRINL